MTVSFRADYLTLILLSSLPSEPTAWSLSFCVTTLILTCALGFIALDKQNALKPKKKQTAKYGPTVVWSTNPRIAGGSDDGVDEEKGEGGVGGGRSSPGDSRDAMLTLGKKHDLRNVGAMPTLRISLWGREVISKDRPLGVTLLDLALLPKEGESVTRWMELEPAVDMIRDTPCGRCVSVSVCLCDRTVFEHVARKVGMKNVFTEHGCVFGRGVLMFWYCSTLHNMVIEKERKSHTRHLYMFVMFNRCEELALWRIPYDTAVYI